MLQSVYWPYLDLLPTREEQQDMVPLHWSAEAVATRLGPSHLVKTILSYQKSTEAKYRSLSNIKTIPKFFTTPNPTAITSADPTSSSSSSSIFTFSNYHWATAILDSRSIWWSGTRHLVPMLDFVNCAEDEGSPDAIHSTTLSIDKKYAVTKAGAIIRCVRCYVIS
jgi:hypothetical protein